jgi:excisionase family DNA binding protein
MATSKEISEKLERIEIRLTELGSHTMHPYDLAGAAEYLGISRSHLYQLTSKGLIGHYKPAGKKLYFDKSDLDEYLRRNRVKPQWEIDKAAMVNG